MSLLSRLVVVTVFVQAAVFATRPMLSYRSLELGAGPVALGFVAAAFAAGPAMAAIPLGRWVDRWGERPFLFLGLGVAAAAMLGLFASESIFALAAFNAVLGLGHLLIVVPNQTLLANTSAPSPDRHRQFGIYSASAAIGQSIGPAIAGYAAAAAGVRSVFLLGVAAMLGAAVVAFRLPSAARRPTDIPPKREGLVRGLQTVIGRPGMARAITLSALLLTSMDLISVYLPALAEQRGLPIEWVGLLLAVRGAASALARLAMSKVVVRLGDRATLVSSLAIPAAAVGLMLLPVGLIPLVILMSLVGFGVGIGQTVTMVQVATLSAVGGRGAAMSTRLGANHVGLLVVPALMGLVGAAAGVSAVFAIVSLMLVAGSVLARTDRTIQYHAS